MSDDSDLQEWLDYEAPSNSGRPKLGWPEIIAAVAAVVVIIGLIALRPTGEARDTYSQELAVLGIPTEFYRADITSVVEGPCSVAPEIQCKLAEFELLEGPDAGAAYSQELPIGGVTPDELRAGVTAVLSYFPPDGLVESVTAVDCALDATQRCLELEIRITSGEYEGALVLHEVGAGSFASSLVSGDEVTLTFAPDEASSLEVIGVVPSSIPVQYQFADFERRPVLWWVAGIFALAVIALGRYRGAAALAGLVASVVVLLAFVLPAILDGRSPVMVAVIGAATIAFFALYLAHGFSRKTTVALLGMLGGLTLTAILSAIVLAVANITGIASEETSLLTLFEGIDLRGLVLAGTVLGAAGALDDVTVTQASAVWELRNANPTAPAHELMAAGLRIGRDHIASAVNTLLLAYAGAALPLLVLFVVSGQSIGVLANSEVVAVEIIRTLVGSIGLVAAVPLTTWLAAIYRPPEAA
ncbi:MAG: YibE/F family protein [Acidimicrobiia bacterium]|nr:YibE/F family protein [Acidimicrobiia bacterium]